MSTIRNLLTLIVIGMLLVSGCTSQPPATSIPGKTAPAAAVPATRPPATATPEPVPEILPALEAAMETCKDVLPGLVCLVEGPVQFTAQPKRYLMPFQKPGQMLSLADIRTLKLGEAGSTRGIAVMRIQTESPGGAFTAVAFGNVELVNEAPYGTREFNPMQSLKLATGPNPEGQTPAHGFLVASPGDGKPATLVVNGAELSFGSGAMLTSQQGGLSIYTMWGVVGWMIDKLATIVQGERVDLTQQDIQERVPREPSRDYAAESVGRLLKKYFGPKEGETVEESIRRMAAEMDARKKQMRWKGGWWKMTYGPVTVSGKCKTEEAGDGGTGDGKPFSTEIPICRGNNGNTILIYDSGVSYDRTGPNLFTQSSVSKFDMNGWGKFSLEGHFSNLQVISPTRMILSNANAEKDSCTTTSIAYLDFLRDDPNIRCGRIIYIDPYRKPKPPAPLPEIKKVESPVKGLYKARISTLSAACAPEAQPFAPSFTTASLTLTPENKLVVEAASTKYELEMSDLAYPCSTEGGGRQDCQGLFSLQQPVNNSFGLTISLGQMPGQLWAGTWLVANQDASQLCGGSIDLLPPQ